jgi:apolipoprotein D and lipocalin family protein
MDRRPPPTAPSLDLTRYLGTWYEIARLPMRHEPAEYTDISASYTRQPDGTIRVDNRAFDGDGQLKESVGEAQVVDPAEPGKLAVSFLPEGLRWIPFTKGDYWILRVDEDYRTALVGSPDFEYLWLLHREPDLDAATRDSTISSIHRIPAGVRLEPRGNGSRALARPWARHQRTSSASVLIVEAGVVLGEDRRAVRLQSDHVGQRLGGGRFGGVPVAEAAVLADGVVHRKTAAARGDGEPRGVARAFQGGAGAGQVIVEFALGHVVGSALK